MKQTSSKPFWQALTLGILAGMRTTAGPLTANQLLRGRHTHHHENLPLKFMRSETAGIVFGIAAVGELITDKLPSTPSRTAPVGVIARCLSGSLAGAAICKANGNTAISGALLGLAGALCATYAFHSLRKNVVKQTHIADPWIGGAEDAIVIGTGIALINA